MNKAANIWLFFAVVISLPFVVYTGVNWYEKTVKPLPVLINNEHTIADYELINQQGKKATTKDWENKIVVANFFFTHCPSICPKMTRNLINVQQSYANNPNVLLVSYSVDPEADSAAVLARYAKRFGINETQWQLLTGSKKEIYRLARTSFQVIATDGDGGEHDFIHSNKLVLIDRTKHIRGYYDGTDEKETAELIKDIKKLENEH
jgi:protein SCO1/2